MRALLIIALALFAANANARENHYFNPHSLRVDLRVVDQACRKAMYYGADVEKCVHLAANARFDPSGLIASCDAAMFYDSDALGCIEIAVGARSDFSPAIAACDRAMYYDSDVKRCLTAALPLGARAADVVQYCDGARYYDSEALSCIALVSRPASRQQLVVHDGPVNVRLRALPR